MDSKFRIPGTGLHFGLDPIITFIPAAGDVVTVFISAMLVYQMNKHGVSRKVLIKMMINILIDGLIGAIPVLGIFFDLAYKANNRNVKLLKEHYQEAKHMGSGNGIIIGFLLLTFLLVGGIIYLFWLMANFIFGYFNELDF